VCGPCPVIEACLDEVLREGDAWSIRGGTTPDERRGASSAASDPRAASRDADTAAERRAAGLELIRAGESPQDVAALCGVTDTTAYRWAKTLDDDPVRATGTAVAAAVAAVAAATDQDDADQHRAVADDTPEDTLVTADTCERVR